MPPKCPICKKETIIERTIRGGERFTDYMCENCTIVWYVGENNEMHIGVSSTHSKASKLSDEEFDKLLKRIIEYEEI